MAVTGKVTVKGTIRRLREEKERSRKELKRIEARLSALEEKKRKRDPDDEDEDDDEDDKDEDDD